VEAGIPARLTAAQGRRFGLTVGTAFLVLAGILWWRDRQTASTILGAIGLTLSLAGLLVPTHLGPVERAWMQLAHAISRVTTPIFMGVIYFVVMTPIGIIRRTVGSDPLVHHKHDDSFWHNRPAQARRSASMERQF
jgi:hypothetical protein